MVEHCRPKWRNVSFNRNFNILAKTAWPIIRAMRLHALLPLRPSTQPSLNSKGKSHTLLPWQSILEFTYGRGSPLSVLGMMESTGQELRTSSSPLSSSPLSSFWSTWWTFSSSSQLLNNSGMSAMFSLSTFLNTDTPEEICSIAKSIPRRASAILPFSTSLMVDLVAYLLSYWRKK